MRALALLAVAALLAGCLQTPFSGAPEAEPVARFDAIRFETEAGAFTAILFPNETPETADFMRGLVERGYYDGREFGRTIPGFVIQQVDRSSPVGDSQEKIPLEADGNVWFSMGALGIARDADPDSGGSQFFVMDFAHAHLYRNYTAFGQVVEGMDVVHAIARVEAINTREGLPPEVSGRLPVHDRVPVDPVKIIRATMTTVELPADVAAQYPRVVGNRTVVESPPTRYTPEWPQNLGVGLESAMTWFVYTPADDPPPDLRDVRALVAGPSGNHAFQVVHDPADPRILHWVWTPAAPGQHEIKLEIAGAVVARDFVHVAS